MTDDDTPNDDNQGDFERLPDGQIRVTGKLLARLQQTAAERQAVVKVHRITMEVAMEVAERRSQELAQQSATWWREVTALTGLPQETNHKADPSTGLITVMEADDAADPGERIGRAMAEALRESGMNVAFGTIDIGGGDDKPVKPGVQ